MGDRDLYDADFVQWSEQQADLLRHSETDTVIIAGGLIRWDAT
jgi:hypothetical protein